MWYPLLTDSQNRPGNGQLLAYKHAVWKVVEVEDVPLSEDDRELWLDRGMPDLDTWPGRPYKMTLEWVGGAEPPWFKEGNTINLVAEFEAADQQHRKALANRPQGTPDPAFKSAADAVVAYQAVVAALRAAGLDGDLAPDGVRMAYRLVCGVRAAQVYLSDSAAGAEVMAAVEDACLRHATRNAESVVLS